MLVGGGKGQSIITCAADLADWHSNVGDTPLISVIRTFAIPYPSELAEPCNCSTVSMIEAVENGVRGKTLRSSSEATTFRVA